MRHGIRDRHQGENADEDDDEEAKDRAEVGDVLGFPKHIMGHGYHSHDDPCGGDRIHQVTDHCGEPGLEHALGLLKDRGADGDRGNPEKEGDHQLGEADDEDIDRHQHAKDDVEDGGYKAAHDGRHCRRHGIHVSSHHVCHIIHRGSSGCANLTASQAEVFQCKGAETIAGGVVDLSEVRPGQAEHQDHDDPEGQLDGVAHGNPVDIQGRIDPDHDEQEGKQSGVDRPDSTGRRLEILPPG